MRTDEYKLMQRIAQDDAKAFQELFYKYYDKIYAFALGILKSKDDANDLAQEVFLKVWNRRKRFDNVRNLGTYLYVMTRNTVYDFLESRLPDVHFDETYEIRQVEHLQPIDFLIEKDLQHIVDLAVDKMPLQRKRIYQMSREEGLSNQEIADKLQLSKKTIEYHLSLALKELRSIVSLGLILYLC